MSEISAQANVKLLLLLIHSRANRNLIGLTSERFKRLFCQCNKCLTVHMKITEFSAALVFCAHFYGLYGWRICIQGCSVKANYLLHSCWCNWL